MFSTFTSLSSILASSPPSEITINSSAVKSLSGTGTYDISEDGQCIGIVNNANHYYLSTNGGQTFKFKGTLPTSISAFHMSDSGQYMIAQKKSDTINVYYSTDYGFSWSTKTMGNGSIESTGISANGQYAIMSGGYSNTSNVFVSIDHMKTFTNITSVTGNNPGKGIGNQAEGSFIDRQTGQNILIASNLDGSNLQYYLSTNVLTANYSSPPSFSVINTNFAAPYGRSAYVNGSCFILTTWSQPNIFISTNSGAEFTIANSTIVKNIYDNYNQGFFYNDNQIISNANGSKIYYVYNNHIYVSTDQLQTSSIYASNVSNEKDSNNLFVGIIKASSTGKYMLTWNNGLIITTNNLI